MQTSEWQRVETLFGQAVAMAPGAREHFLIEACGDDTDLHREIASLLAAHVDANTDFLDQLDGPAIDRLVDVQPPPERIGAWRVVEEIGRGGMGVVYLAQRDDGQFEQRAALKLIKRGQHSDHLLARFLRERQILARMEHPAIARLLDGGVTAEGRPWFALDYVDGTPLTKHCEAHRLDLRQRLRLFRDICSAVEYAHRRLVIHRDLKPSNVLVDTEGHIKLLDFGIAKLLYDDDEAGEAPTLVDGRPMTPGYGAPEQWLGGQVTTATDVYSLGVILYELLCGERPFSSDPREFAHQVLSAARSEPPKLSAIAARAAETTIAPLDQTLGNELDAIAGRAIRSEPERRYPSAEALREDIERYQRGEPVRVCADSSRYRARKFLRRHRAAVAAAIVVTLSLVIGLGAALWQAGVAAQQRDIARQESEEAQQVKNFIIDLFRASDPRDQQGIELTAKQLIERGLERVRSDHEGRPDLRVELLTAIGGVAKLLGDYEGASKMFEEALTLELGPDPRDRLRVAAALNGLGETSAYLGTDERAEDAHRRALAIRLEFAGPESREAANSHNNLGVALARQRELDEAIEHYLQALDILRRSAGEEAPVTLETLGNLATAYRLQGDLPEAKRIFDQVIDSAERAGGQDAQMAVYTSELAAIERRLGHYAEAERLLRQSYQLSSQFWGESHPGTRISMNNLAMAAHALGNDRQAEALMRKVLAYDLEQYGPEHRYVALGRDNLGRILVELGRLDEALAQFDTSQPIQRQNASQHALAIHQANHALARLAADQIDLARQLIDRALATERRNEPLREDRLATALTTSGFVSLRAGDLPRAAADLHQAAALFATGVQAQHPQAGLIHLGRGEVYLAQNQLREARAALEHAASIWRATLPQSHWRHASLSLALGECEIRAGNVEAGRKLVDQALAQLRRDRGETHWRTLAAVRRAATLSAATFSVATGR
ncbi:MAG: serine/threonine-protein kinase [Acidobacteriota bacterium]